MYQQVEVAYQGQTEFVATDREAKPLDIYVRCPDGLEAGVDVRVSISTFHSTNRQWTLGDPYVEKGEGWRKTNGGRDSSAILASI